METYEYHRECYPAHVLIDRIYRTKANIAFCQKNERLKLWFSVKRVFEQILYSSVFQRNIQVTAI